MLIPFEYSVLLRTIVLGSARSLSLLFLETLRIRTSVWLMDCRSINTRGVNESTLINQQDLTSRLARLNDFHEILKLSEVIYDGHDYLPVRFHTG